MRDIVPRLLTSVKGLSHGKGLLYLRIIHTSWMLWLVTVVFTILVSPHTLALYKTWWAFLFIPAAIVLAAYAGFKIGERVPDFFKNGLIKNVEIGSKALFIACSALILFFIILIMDIVSVTTESYDGLWGVSLILLCVVTVLLILAIINSKINVKKGE